ncbi:MAG: retropepsin-like domain-containing protein [Bacteroidetes bacterium]|nr:retropepsin-like domain-containing protein [Bacteroidota bacterium]
MTKAKRKAIKLLLENLQQNGYHIFVTVKVNGLRCRFLVDTGASKTVIDKTYVEKKFGKRIVKTIKQQTTGLHSTTHESYTARVATLTLGTVVVKNCTLAAIDLSHVNGTYAALKTKKIQGILGSDLMVQERMIIDYNTLTLSFA